MTRFSPSLLVTRMVIEKDANVVYDEIYHPRVNIIRGENSSGKSTILNFLFYGLGGDLYDWSEAAQLCTRVVIEISANGVVATLSRHIAAQRGQPMEIFGGSLEKSRTAPRAEWIRYPYSRSTNLESFSQALFRLLGLPEVASELSGNVTIHQVLRLLYADQLSPVEDLFKFERFDPPNLRDIIGRLLCGAYDGSLYSNELKARSLQRDLDSINNELKSLVSVLGQAEQKVSLEWAYEQQKALEEERAKLRQEIESAEAQVFAGAAPDELTLTVQREAYSAVSSLQGTLSKTRERLDSLLLEIADSANFMRSLEAKLEALKDASSTSEYLGEVSFDTCPACYAPIKRESPDTTTCHLCKTPYGTDRSKDRLAGMVNDCALQLNQSRTLQRLREQRAKELEQRLGELDAQWRTAAYRFSELRRLPSSEAREKLRELQRRAGYVDRQMDDHREKSRLVVLFNDKLDARNRITAEISRVTSTNAVLRKSQEDNLNRAYDSVANTIRWLLQHDLRRQDAFETANLIQFDFASNRISVDGVSYFSASSRVILKSSFFAGFLFAATNQSYFRHPRFCMIDTIEDKGMEPARSHNFQRLIVKLSEESKVEHQVIFATAMIAPELDTKDYTVGKNSTRDARTLTFTRV